MCLDILKSPVSAIEKSRKKSMGYAIKVMLMASLVFAASAGVFALKLLSAANIIIILFTSVFAVFVFAVVSITLIALAVEMAASILGGKGGYYEGLASVSLSSFIFSIGTLIASLLLLVPFGMVVALVILVPTFAVSIAVLYRAIKELFRTDMITSFVTVSVTMLAVIVSLYLVLLLGIMPDMMGSLV